MVPTPEYDGKINTNIKQKQNGLSSTWFKAQAKTNMPIVQQLKKNIYNYFRNILDTKSGTVMWTTFKEFWTKLRGKGYSKQFRNEQLENVEKAYGFLSCNARTINKYSDCYNLAYCVNIYLHVGISQFFR